MGIMRVGIITIGNELLSGFTLDRNAAWIGQQLLSSGIKVNEPSGALLLSPPKSWNPKNPCLLLPEPALVL